MTTHRSATIQLSRRAFATALLAAATLGIGIGEVAAPLASSQAHPVAKVAAAPGSILQDASKYPALVPKAEQAGASKSATKIAAITAQLKSVNAAIQAQASRFSALKGPILSEETKCLR